MSLQPNVVSCPDLLIAEIFLISNRPIPDLISSECPRRRLEMRVLRPACCELVKHVAEESNEKTPQNQQKLHQKAHVWLDPQLIENLPVNLKKGK